MDHDYDTYYHSNMTEEQQSEECCLLSLVSVQLSVNIQWRLGAGFSHLHTVVVPALSSQLQVPTWQSVTAGATCSNLLVLQRSLQCRGP